MLPTKLTLCCSSMWPVQVVHNGPYSSIIQPTCCAAKWNFINPKSSLSSYVQVKTDLHASSQRQISICSSLALLEVCIRACSLLSIVIAPERSACTSRSCLAGKKWVDTPKIGRSCWKTHIMCFAFKNLLFVMPWWKWNRSICTLAFVHILMYASSISAIALPVCSQHRQRDQMFSAIYV